VTVNEQHPDEAELDAARTGEADAEVVAHLDRCPACRARSALHQRLGRELAEMPRIVVPAEVDLAVTDLAREQLRRGQRPRRLLRWVAPLAAAAAVLVAVVVPRWTGTPAEPRDVNRDGVVDILDALALARAVEGGTASAQWDFDGNARVDAADVDRVALAAVTVGGGTP
jgi:predicted anti-sigma-YlaC factor YlaD